MKTNIPNIINRNLKKRLTDIVNFWHGYLLHIWLLNNF